MDYTRDILQGKKIALFVTGSIAIYKSLELVRLFTKAGAQVRAVMREEAKKFVTPLAFEALSKNVVLSSDTESWASENNHIDIGKFADVGVLAPATANTLNSLAHGIANNILLSSLLAFGKKVITAPAANTGMYKNHTTQSSLKLLTMSKYIFVSPTSKTLICNDEGVGAMADIEDIFFATARELLRSEYFIDRKAVITAGGSIEPIDGVRFVSNFSSGKMGYYMALALFLRGSDVCLLHTNELSNGASSLFHTIKVSTGEEIKSYLESSLQYAKLPTIHKPNLSNDLQEPKSVSKTPYLFMAAAVSDYTPKYPQQGKMKKEQIGEEWIIELIKNQDVLASVDKEGIYAVGFKAEMNEAQAQSNAKKMKQDKELDAVILNVLQDKNSFGTEEMATSVLTQKGSLEFPRQHKLLLCLEMIEHLSTELHE